MSNGDILRDALRVLIEETGAPAPDSIENENEELTEQQAQDIARAYGHPPPGSPKRERFEAMMRAEARPASEEEGDPITQEAFKTLFQQPDTSGDSPVEAAFRVLGGDAEVKLPPNFPQTDPLVAFGKGVVEGATEPLRLLGLHAEFETDRPIAEMLGEFTGMGVSFVPFFKGAQATIKGAGLLAGMSESAATGFLSTTSGRALTGGLSFGAFEAGMAEDPLEVPAKFTTGFAIGAVTDPILAKGLDLALARKAIKGRATSKGPLQSADEPVQATILPSELSLERSLHPSKFSAEEVGEAITKIADAQFSLPENLAQMAHAYRPGSVTIIPAVENPGQTISRLKKILPKEAKFSTRRGDGDLFEVRVFDDTPRLRTVAEIVTKREKTSAEQKLVRRFRDEVDIDMTIEEGASLVNKTESSPGVEVRLLGDIFEHGHIQYSTPNHIIRINEANPELAQISTLVHESTHHVFSFLTSKRPLSTADDLVTPMLRELGREADPETVVSLRSQLDDMTREAIIHQRMSIEGVSRKKAVEGFSSSDGFTSYPNVDEWLTANADYIKSDSERFAHAASLLFHAPKRAKTLGPDVVDLLPKLYERQMPRLNQVFSKEEMILVEDIVRHTQKHRVFDRVKIPFTDKMRKQWKKHGLSETDEVMYQGASWEVTSIPKRTRLKQRGKRKDTEQLINIRNTMSGETRTVPLRRVQRPLLPQVKRRTSRLVQQMDEVLARGVEDWVPVALRHADQETLVVQGAIDLRNFGRVRDGNVRAWIEENAPEALISVSGRRSPTPGPVTDGQITNAANRMGLDGVLIEDAGQYRAVIANQESIALNSQAVSEEIARSIDGTVGNTSVNLSFENVTRGLLREAGVTDREMPYFLELAKERHGKRLRDLMDDEVKEAVEGARDLAGGVEESLEDFARRAGLEVERSNGRVGLRHADNKTKVASGLTDEQAERYIMESGTPETPVNFDQQAKTATDAMGESGGGGRPPKFHEQVSVDAVDDVDGFTFEKLVDAVGMMGAPLTGMENFMKIVQERGLGPTFTKFFDPIQKALEAVDNKMGNVARGITHETFEKQLIKIRELTEKLPKERRELVTDYIEFMTKQEIERPGALLQRGMNETEIKIANRIAEMGLGDDVPRLQATGRLVENLINNKQKFVNAVNAMERQELSPAMQQTIQRLRQMAANDIDDFQTGLEALGLSQEEQLVTRLIQQLKEKPLDEISLMAIGRHASAPKLPKKFSSGREWFRQSMDMTEEELELARLMEEVFEEGAKLAGFDEKRIIGGYFPHLRKYTESGFTTNERFIKEHIPEVYDWIHEKVRSGEIDIYAKDPTRVTHKYIRSLLMKQEFDPIMPQLKETVAAVEARDGRVARIMKETLDEALGRPHASFQKIEQAISGTLKAFGIDPGKGFVKKYVNTMTSLVYGATIPFRPALIARNFYQLVQTIPGRVGARDFMVGLKRAIEDEGYQMARRAGAIPENVAPVHATSELFERGLIGDLNLGTRLDALVKKGFDYYRSADDFGRAVAYHAQRSRISRHVDDYMNGKIEWESFLNRSKVSTYRKVDQQQFAQIFEEQGSEAAKDYLGRVLARETMFRYGHANHPAGWGGISGRLFGQFGTWPVQYKDYVLQGLTRGTTKDKAEFIGWQLASNLGVVGGGAAVGLDLAGWAAFPGLTYTGGPFVDLAIDASKLISGSETEKALAMRSLTYQLPTLENPQSIFLPMSYALGDLGQLIKNPGAEGTLEAFGFKLLQPGEKSAVDFLFDF